MKLHLQLSFSLLGDRVDDRQTAQAAISVAIVFVLTAYFLYKIDSPSQTYPNVPLIGKKPGEWTSKRAKT